MVSWVSPVASASVMSEFSQWRNPNKANLVLEINFKWSVCCWAVQERDNSISSKESSNTPPEEDFCGNQWLSVIGTRHNILRELFLSKSKWAWFWIQKFLKWNWTSSDMFQTVPPLSPRNKYYSHSFARMTVKMLGVMVVNLLISSLMSCSRFVCWLQANPSSFTGHPDSGYQKSQ